MTVKRELHKGKPTRSVHGVLVTDCEETWTEDGVTIRYRKFFRVQSEDRVYEDGAGEGLKYVINKYSGVENGASSGYLKERITFDWTPSSGRRKRRLEEWFTAGKWKICEYRYDEDGSLTDLIYFSARGQILSHSQFDAGNGPFVRYDESGTVYEFGTFVGGEKDGTVYRKWEGNVFVQEWSEGKKLSSEKHGLRVWPEMLRDNGIT